MSDELVESAEFGRKKKNEEEPILVAQRFLNIYRQMHIFNKERQEQFDDMLLALPSDIRILLSTLPGGSLLLEHIEEVDGTIGDWSASYCVYSLWVAPFDQVRYNLEYSALRV